MLNTQRLRARLDPLFRQAPVVYFVFLLLATSFSVVLLSHGYELVVTNRAVWFILSTLIQIALAGICFVKRKEFSPAAVLTSQALPLLTVVYYCYIDSLLHMVPTIVIAIHALLYMLPCYIISLLHMQSRWRILFAMLNTLLLIAFMLLFFLAATFGSLGERKVVKEVLSPDGSYRATIISADSGALGGATNVEVEKVSSSFGIGFGRFAKVQYIYSGGWNAFKTISVKWKNDHTILINGAAYYLTD